jgi:hypothetical protein
MAHHQPLALLRGARAIATFIDGDDRYWRTIPRLAEEGWPLFKANGQWRARPDALAQEVEAREQRVREAAAEAERERETAEAVEAEAPAIADAAGTAASTGTNSTAT